MFENLLNNYGKVGSLKMEIEALKTKGFLNV